jgi:hypothetical protein
MFWIELESEGKKEKFGEFLAEMNRGTQEAATKSTSPGPTPVVEGYWGWIREKTSDAVNERWHLAFRRDLVARESTDVRVEIPLAEATTSQSKEQRSSESSSMNHQVKVWRARPAEKKVDQHAAGAKQKLPSANIQAGAVAGSSSVTTTTIPNPLPSNQEVCIREIREALSFSEHLMKGEKPDHVIRIMCRVVSEKSKPSANTTASK